MTRRGRHQGLCKAQPPPVLPGYQGWGSQVHEKNSKQRREKLMKAGAALAWLLFWKDSKVETPSGRRGWVPPALG